MCKDENLKDKDKGCGCGGHHHEEGHTCGGECGCSGEGHDHEHEALVYIFEDENGNEIECEIVDVFELEDEEYAVLENLQDESRTILKITGEDEGGAPSLSDISDEEFAEVAKHYENLIASEVLTEEE